MAKTLYLVRHAKSSWSDSSLTDKERPLNKRGKRTAPDMGRRLAQEDHQPDLVISSPARRAFSTAKIIARALSYEISEIIIDESLYFSGEGSMVKMLGGLDDRYQSAMIVGHNPAMTSLLNSLCDAGIYNMPTCAIAIVTFDTAFWSELSDVNGRLIGYDFPKNTRGFTAGSEWVN